MMTNRELLELAAKAIGLEYSAYDSHYVGDYYDPKNGASGLIIAGGIWNPLEDDGDAFCLAVKVIPCLSQWKGLKDYEDHVMVGYPKGKNDGGNLYENHGDDPIAATRRAIVRAAAEIGKGMK